MKSDEMKERLKTEEGKEKTGTCKFCRQIRMVEAPESWTQEDIDEYITETCTCNEAQELTRKKRRRERVQMAIEKTFREGGGTHLPESVISLLKTAAELIETHELEEIQVKLEGVTGKICEGKEGSIKVTGSRKLENGEEV